MSGLTLTIAEVAARLGETRDKVRSRLDRGELPYIVDERGYRRPLAEAVTRLEQRQRGPRISPEDYVQFAGAEHHEPKARQYHEAGARLAWLARERRELEATRAGILAELDAEASELDASGWLDAAGAAASRASALRASAYVVVGGVVRIVSPPGGMPPGMPADVAIDDLEDKAPAAGAPGE